MGKVLLQGSPHDGLYPIDLNLHEEHSSQDKTFSLSSMMATNSVPNLFIHNNVKSHTSLIFYYGIND